MLSQGPRYVKEYAEDRVFPEDVRIVISVPTYRHCRRSGGLLERHARERDNILILREFEQHIPHRVRTLYDVREAIERRVVQDVANNVRVDARCYSVHYSDGG